MKTTLNKNQRIMKTSIITCLAIAISALSFGQTKSVKGDVKLTDFKIENFKIEVEVDSAEEIKSTFTVDDFKEILEETGNNEDLEFKIKCNSEENANGTTSYVTYKVKGNTNDKKSFLKSVKKIRKAAIKYYNSKK